MESSNALLNNQGSKEEITGKLENTDKWKQTHYKTYGTQRKLYIYETT